MYNISDVLEQQRKIIAIIEANTEDLKHCIVRSNLNPNTVKMPHIFYRGTTTYIPEFREIWDKLLDYCKTHRQGIYVEKSILKRQMQGNLSHILQRLAEITKRVIYRLSAERIELLEEDQRFFDTEFGSQATKKTRDELSYLSECMAFKQSKKVVHLSND